MVYNEKNFTPSSVVFTTNKEGLYECYRSHPEYENLLVTLLRTYEGIFDFPVLISESLLAKLLRTDEQKVKDQLQKAGALGIIRYTPLNDEPQIFLRKNRVAARDLQIDLKQYQQRKEQFIQRVKTMTDYLQTNHCRSHFISHYFGDKAATDCSTCDTCLARRRKDVSADEFAAIVLAIRQHLSQCPVTATQLVSDLSSLKQEKTWAVLKFLQAEQQICADDKGILRNK
jgi:ATP-dependent DNA helicase RecQ